MKKCVLELLKIRRLQFCLGGVVLMLLAMPWHYTTWTGFWVFETGMAMNWLSFPFTLRANREHRAMMRAFKAEKETVDFWLKRMFETHTAMVRVDHQGTWSEKQETAAAFENAKLRFEREGAPILAKWMAEEGPKPPGFIRLK